MPRLVAKVEGKGNGVKTVIPNMVDIARSLERPPTCKFSSKLSLSCTVSTSKSSYAILYQLFIKILPLLDVTKYFGCELGAQTQFDFKNDRYIVNGVHEAGKLQVC